MEVQVAFLFCRPQPSPGLAQLQFLQLALWAIILAPVSPVPSPPRRAAEMALIASFVTFATLERGNVARRQSVLCWEPSVQLITIVHGM
mmetsp:Transcript_47457/g.106658  ORF Transcript_47457/g.106658 Transcript_47457/m.106658 type:complete len:89 (-) Transcript_47457:458-724(-)